MSKGRQAASARFFGKEQAGAFFREVVLYGFLMVAYVLGVLHFLGPSLKRIFDAHKVTYAVIALGLILTQGALLEMVTRTLSQRFKRHSR